MWAPTYTPGIAPTSTDAGEPEREVTEEEMADCCRADELDRLHQIGADHPRGRQRRVRQHQHDDHDGAASDRGHADEESTDRPDEETSGGGRTKLSVHHRCGRGAAAGLHDDLDEHAGGRDQKYDTQDHFDVVLETRARDSIDEVGAAETWQEPIRPTANARAAS